MLNFQVKFLLPWQHKQSEETYPFAIQSSKKKCTLISNQMAT